VSTKERSDYTVIAIVGVDSVGTILVRDIRRGRWDAHQIVEEMFQVHARYKPELFVVEQGVIHRSISPFLTREQQLRQVYLNLFPMTPTKDKLSRARSLQARLRSGNIRFDKEASWYPTLEDEMVRFPKDRHDDQVDALSWIGLALDVMQEAPTQKEIEDEEWEEEHDTSQQYTGRSLTCGY
jgi:predicted phage terminase large subunit-like protein